MARIRSANLLTRQSNYREVRKKYFFALEGTDTEVRYLKSLIGQYEILNHIYYFYQSKNDKLKNDLTNNVKDMVDKITCIIDKNGNNIDVTYENIYSYILDSFMKENIIVNKNKLKSYIQRYANNYNKNFMSIITETELDGLIEYLFTILPRTSLNDFESNEFIENIKLEFLYTPEVDDICIIADRDLKSFTDAQYDYVLSKIKNKKIELYISNPCIEFWLLLHHTAAISIDKTKWHNDNAATLVYQKLKEFDLHYGKTTVNFKYYLANTEKAIENSNLYAKDLIKLKKEIGTNIPYLISKLKDIS